MFCFMRKNRFLVLCSLIAFALSTFSLSSCWEEQHPGTYYTFTGQTIGSALAAKPEYSDFVRILERSGMWNNLITYGYNTCFAPDNDAIAQFLKEREAFARKQGKDVTYNTVEDLPKEDCDTLAWTHLLDITCYVGDLVPGLLPKVNLNDRFLILTLDSTRVEQLGDSVIALQRRLNNAIIMEKDDSCENGVVHYINSCIDFGGDYVYDLVDNDPKTQLFSQALKECGFHKILSEWYDPEYPKKIKADSDSVLKGIGLTSAGNNYTVFYWDKRKTNFTLLVPTDQIFARHGINDLDDMFNYAKTIYTDYNDNDSILADYKNPNNPLFKFISYHILPFLVDLSRINGRKDIVKTYNAKITYPEDYFETYLPKSLMRICTKLNGDDIDIQNVYINSNMYTILSSENRKEQGNGSLGFNGAKIRGVKILTPEEMGVTKYSALNGVYHYVDDILVYDENVRENVLDRRIRIDCTTLSPDFITSGARQFDASKTGVSRYGSGFLDPKNFCSYQSEYTLSVRAPNTSNSYAYEGDGIDIEGQFDMYVKLPPVPHNGTWQLRLSFRSNSLCGIIQTYWAALPFGQDPERTDWKPLGLPIDLRVNLTDSSVGWIEDDDLADDEAIEALDKSMKNRSWMKGSDAQKTATNILHRNVDTMGRLILAPEYMTSNTDYYIRFKQLLANKKAEFLFDYIELVPKSVYDIDEDKH